MSQHRSKQILVFAFAAVGTYLVLVVLVILLSGGGVSCQPASCNGLENFLSDSQPFPPLAAGGISLTVGLLVARRIGPSHTA